MIDLSVCGDAAWIAWHGYDAAGKADHVYARRAGGHVLRLTDTAGDHMRPAISTRQENDTADAVWVMDQRVLVHTVVSEGCVQLNKVMESRSGWLRDPALWRHGDALWCAVIVSSGRGDRLLLWRWDASRWERVMRLDTEGFAARPSGAGNLVAFDHYAEARYRVRIASTDGQTMDEIASGDGNVLQPRLLLDAEGAPWLCALHERVVQRDGVVNRAAWATVATRKDGTWRMDPTVAPLHRGLLPNERYFGYAGLRRNPRLMATDDGRMHLLWEQQRDEYEHWHNVWNGLLLSMSWCGVDWEPPRVLHEGGCCFAVDHRAIQSAATLRFAYKGDHRDDGADFVMAETNLGTPPRAPVHCLSENPGWEPYPLPRRPARPDLEIDGVTHYLLFGDLHNHSIFSPDAEGHPDELYHFARDVAGIDFAGITDNDFYPEKALLLSESAYQRRLTKRLETEGDFFPFCGFEWTFHRNDGKDSYNHRSVVFLDEESRIVRRIDEEGKNEQAFTQSLARLDVFAHAHHGEFTLLGTQQEANVEVTSGWAVNMEVSQVAHEHLLRNARFGFIGGSDGHRAVPGLGGALIGVWVRDTTRQEVVEALRARRCFATAGDHIAVDFRAVGPGAFRAFAVAPCPLHRVSVVKNGGVVHEFSCSGRELNGRWTDSDAAAGDWYYLRVEQQVGYRHHPHNICQAAGPLAWSSPVWIES